MLPLTMALEGVQPGQAATLLSKSAFSC